MLRAELRRPSADLRDLARGIYPPLLADQGLVTALRMQAAKARCRSGRGGQVAVPATPRATVYFCALEALQNVAKYAPRPSRESG